MRCIFEVMRVNCGTISNAGIALHGDENSGFLKRREFPDKPRTF